MESNNVYILHIKNISNNICFSTYCEEMKSKRLGCSVRLFCHKYSK